MPTAIDQRLASLWHRDRIDLHAAVERGLARLDAPYRQLLRELVGLASEPQDEAGKAVGPIIDRAFRQSYRLIGEGFEAVVHNAHCRALRALARTVPRKWLRILGVFRERIADDPAEPPMSAEQWEAMLAEMTFPPPDAATVAGFLDHKGPGGLAWDERLASWEGPVRQQLRGQLLQGMSAGEGLHDLRKRLDPIVGGVRYKAQRIARTEGRRVAELAQQRTLQQAGDLIAAQEIIAVLDENTRPEHALRHGKRYERQPDSSFVADDGEPLPDLPDAPNCRCFASPVLATPQEFLDNPALAADFRNATADTIPDPAAYVRWFTAAELPRRMAAVGARRYRTAAKRLGRTPEWADFLEPDGRLMKLKRLKGQSMADWEARRAAVEQVIRGREALLARAVA